MNIVRKTATITPTGSETDFPGTFEVILSAPTKDRDGDTLLPEEWKQPLPEHITFDIDHGMSVATTVGSGTPSIDAKTGNLVVRGTYSSLDRAQEVRTLVNEGHIRTTSVAFMNEPATVKDGKKVNQRELLNGAFVAVPSNREAVITNSKGYNENQPETVEQLDDYSTKSSSDSTNIDSDVSEEAKSAEEVLKAAAKIAAAIEADSAEDADSVSLKAQAMNIIVEALTSEN